MKRPKLFKVYVVQGEYLMDNPIPQSIISKILTRLYGLDDKIHMWDTVAVFSNHKKAKEFKNNGVFPFEDEVVGRRIQDWKVDYEIYWKEWNKLEESKKEGK